jgi:7-carboxy-7-deazaguanine synthase
MEGMVHPASTPSSPSAPDGASILPVVETFHSLQGEGLHSGRSAFFLRLAGCDVGCAWCDTKHSWNADRHPLLPLAELADRVKQARSEGAAFVVITGGEPLHHGLGPLCAALAPLAPLHLETSGVDPLSGRFDWITLSPKRHRPPRPELLAACDELKVVVHGEQDLAFASAMAASAPGAQLLLQPGWGATAGQELAVAFVKRHPAWRLSLQSHKLLGLR